MIEFKLFLNNTKMNIISFLDLDDKVKFSSISKYNINLLNMLYNKKIIKINNKYIFMINRFPMIHFNLKINEYYSLLYIKLKINLIKNVHYLNLEYTCFNYDELVKILNKEFKNLISVNLKNYYPSNDTYFGIKYILS